MPPDEQFRPIGANIPDIGLQDAQAGYVFRNISVDQEVLAQCNEKYFVRAASKKLWEFLSIEDDIIKIVEGPPGVGTFLFYHTTASCTFFFIFMNIICAIF